MQPIRDHSSPNWNDRPEGASIDTVVLHYTGMKSCAGALARLCDPAAQVSAHYLIDEDGSLFQLVAEQHRAWHAGVSRWQGRDNLNHHSIGIELVNPGHEFGYRPFPEAQIHSLLQLLAGIQERHLIPRANFVGHSDIAPERKSDPGELFPWALLAEKGYGIYSWLNACDTTVILQKGNQGEEVNKLNQQLGVVGYHGFDYDTFGGGTERVIKAFQTHWRPAAVTGIFDKGTAMVLNEIARTILVGDF